MKTAFLFILLILLASGLSAEDNLECTDQNKINLLIKKGIMTKETCFNISGNELSLKILGQTYQLADIDPHGDKSIKEYDSLCSDQVITKDLTNVVSNVEKKPLSDLSAAELSFMRFGEFVEALKIQIDEVAKKTGKQGSSKISMESTGYADGVRVFTNSELGYKLDSDIYKWLNEITNSGGTLINKDYDNVWVHPEKFKVAACNIYNVDIIKDHSLFADDSELQKMVKPQHARFHIQRKYLDSPRNYFIAYNRAKNLTKYVKKHIGAANVEKSEILGKISKRLQTGKNMCRGYCTMRRGASLKMTLPGQAGKITTYLPQEGEANPVYNSPLSGDYVVMDRIAVQTLINDFSDWVQKTFATTKDSKTKEEITNARKFFKRFYTHVVKNRKFFLRNTEKHTTGNAKELKKELVGYDNNGVYDSGSRKGNSSNGIIEVYKDYYLGKEIEIQDYEAEIQSINGLLKKFLIAKNGDLARNLFEDQRFDGSLSEDARFFNASKRIFWQNIYNIDYQINLPRLYNLGKGLTRVPKSGQEDQNSSSIKISFLGHIPSEKSDIDFLTNYLRLYDEIKNPIKDGKKKANQWQGYLIKPENLKKALSNFKAGSEISITNDKGDTGYKYALTDEEIGTLNTMVSIRENAEYINIISDFAADWAQDFLIKSKPYLTKLVDPETSAVNVYFYNFKDSLVHDASKKVETIKPTLLRILAEILNQQKTELYAPDEVLEQKRPTTEGLLAFNTKVRSILVDMVKAAIEEGKGDEDIFNDNFYVSPFKSDNGVQNIASTIYSLLDYRHAYAKILVDNFDKDLDEKLRHFPARPDDFLQHTYGIKGNPSKFGKIVSSQMLPIKDYVTLTKIYFRPDQFHSRHKVPLGDSSIYRHKYYSPDGSYGRSPNKYDWLKGDIETVGVYHPACNTGTFFYNISDVDKKFLEGQLTEQKFQASSAAKKLLNVDRTKFHYFSRMQSNDKSMVPEGDSASRSSIIQAWDKSFHAVDDYYPVPKFNLIKVKHPITYVIPNCGKCGCLRDKSLDGNKLEALLNGALELDFYKDYSWIIDNPDTEHPEEVAVKEFVVNKQEDWQKSLSDEISKQNGKIALPLEGKNICLYSPLIPQSHNAGSGGGTGNKTDNDDSDAHTEVFCPIVDALATLPDANISPEESKEIQRVCFNEIKAFPMSDVVCAQKQHDVCTFLPDKYANTYPAGSAKCMHPALKLSGVFNAADRASAERALDKWYRDQKADSTKPGYTMEPDLCKLLTTKFDKDGNPQ